MISPRALLSAAGAIVILSGCDVPTEPPLIQQDWMVEVDETSLSVEELLPSSVTVAGDNFEVSVDPVGAIETLGGLCGADCEAVNGTVAPVPPFEGDFTATQVLPDEVVSADVAGGSIDVAITNGFTFDPLENGGTIVIEIADDATGVTLGEIVLDGATGDALLPTTTVTRTLQLSSGTVTGALRAVASVNVPGGQTALIDVSDVIEVTATVNSFLVSSVTLNVDDRTVSFEEQAIDFEDIDTDITDRIVEGSIVLDVTNPFGVSVDGFIDIGTTSKSFSIDGSASSVVPLTYTGDELRSFIGQPNVTFSGSGTASGTDVTIQPNQEMAVRATLAITLEIG
ncbi:MAG: hypothetical protein WD995_05880 [Gemmatimonadota bacterium]